MRLAIPIALAALAIAPASAGAETFCVSSGTGCPAGPNSVTTLQAAAAAAQNNGPQIDRIEVQPGVLLNTNVSFGANNPVQLVGAGRDATTLVGAAGNSANVIQAYGSSTTVSDIGIRLAAGDPRFGLLVSGGTAEDIRVDGTTNQATGGVGASVINGGTLRDIVSILPPSGSTYALDANANIGQTSTIENAEAAGSFGLATRPAGSVDARRLSIRAALTGVAATGNGTTYVRNSLIRSTGSNFDALLASTTPSTSPRLDARHVTAIGDGSAGTSGAHSQASSSGQTATVNLRDSILRGYATSLLAAGQGASVATSYSDYPPTISQPAMGVVTQGAGNVDTDPLFADATVENFALSPASPLIDLGDPAAPSTSTEPTDLAGQPRLDDGDGNGEPRSDIGAFEYQRPVPAIPVAPLPVDPPGTPPVNDIVAPALSNVGLTNSTFRVGSKSTAVTAAKKKAPQGTTLKYALSEAAKIQVAVEQRTIGARVTSRGKPVCARRTRARRKARRCDRYLAVKTLSRSGKAGSNTVAFTGRIAGRALKPGSYRLRLTATDSAGNRSKPRTVAFRIVH